MDLTKYKNQISSLQRCVTNVELAQTNYRRAEECVSYCVAGADEVLKIAKEQLELTKDTLERQFRIFSLQNKEVSNEN